MGTGWVGIFGDGAATAEEHAAAVAVQTDEVKSGQVGSTTYNFIATTGDRTGLGARRSNRAWADRRQTSP